MVVVVTLTEVLVKELWQRSKVDIFMLLIRGKGSSCQASCHVERSFMGLMGVESLLRGVAKKNGTETSGPQWVRLRLLTCMDQSVMGWVDDDDAENETRKRWWGTAETTSA